MARSKKGHFEALKQKLEENSVSSNPFEDISNFFNKLPAPKSDLTPEALGSIRHVFRAELLQNNRRVSNTDFGKPELVETASDLLKGLPDVRQMIEANIFASKHGQDKSLLPAYEEAKIWLEQVRQLLNTFAQEE